MKKLILFLIITVSALTTSVFAQFQPQNTEELQEAAVAAASAGGIGHPELTR